MPEMPRYHILPTGTVDEVITVLQTLKERAMIEGSSIIKTYDGDCDGDEKLTGMIVDPDGTIHLYTDED